MFYVFIFFAFLEEVVDFFKKNVFLVMSLPICGIVLVENIMTICIIIVSILSNIYAFLYMSNGDKLLGLLLHNIVAVT